MSELHLTRAAVALGRPPTRERGVTAEYSLHQTVADLFGDQDSRGYVWRELSRTSGEAEVLVLSSARPALDAGPSMPPHRRVTSVATRPFRPKLSVGQRLDFELRVNATRIVTSAAPQDDLMVVEESRVRKQRRDIWDAVFAGGVDDAVSMADVYARWLRERLADVAEVGEVALTERRLMSVRRSIGHPPMPIVTVNLVGDLLVRDDDALVIRMVSGIGRARAFGCGLLCLARLGSRPRRHRTSELGTVAASGGQAVTYG